FDSLLKVIHLAGMEEVLEDEEVTFFAPSDQMIEASVASLNRYLQLNGKDTVSDLSQISSETWNKMISLYIFSGKFRLNDFPQIDTLNLLTYPGAFYKSYGGRPMNIGVIYHDVKGVKYGGYRQILLSYLTDFANPNRNNRRVPVSSSDIQPKNGVVHTLQFHNHYFGFDTLQFVINVVENGISYK